MRWAGAARIRSSRASPAAASMPRVALALVMIYQATHHVNFAQGEMATFSTYIALTLIKAGVPYWVAFVVTVAISFVIGVAIERVLMRPMANAPVLASVGVFIGLLLIFNSRRGWLFDYTIKQFPSPFGERQPMFGGLCFAHTNWARPAVTLIVLSRSICSSASPASGLACARRHSIRCRRGWSASASAGCWRSAGGWRRGSARSRHDGGADGVPRPQHDGGILLYAFAGALLGGIDSPLGAVLGGFAVGVIENLMGAYRRRHGAETDGGAGRSSLRAGGEARPACSAAPRAGCSGCTRVRRRVP